MEVDDHLNPKVKSMTKETSSKGTLPPRRLKKQLGEKMKKFCLLGTVAALVTVFTMTATAADWNFYGSARIATFVTDTDNKGNLEDTTNFDQNLHSNARIGAKIKVSDTLAGRFEYGASGGNANIRHLFGEWNFGSGKILVGQTDTPVNMFLSQQVYGGDKLLDPYGHVDGQRHPMVRLSFGNFNIAAIQPETTTWVVPGTTPEVNIPKIEASYRLEFDNAFLDFQGGYQTYEIKDTATFVTHDVTSYVIAIGGQIKLGAAYIGADVWFGKNTGPYKLSCDADDNPAVSGTSFIDNDSLGYAFIGGFKLNETISFEAGYGYTQGELDQSAYEKDKLNAYYLQSTITLAQGVFFVPEIGVIDNKKDKNGNEEPELRYAGIKWQINF